MRRLSRAGYAAGALTAVNPDAQPCRAMQPRSAKIPPEALPRSDAARLDWLRLARSRRVGPATFIRLIREHGSAAAALDALPAHRRRGRRRATTPPASRAEAEAEWRGRPRPPAPARCCSARADYPPLLATIADPPPLLWALGDPALAARPGGRAGRRAQRLGARLPHGGAARAPSSARAGFVVASGLARGIDAAAHRAALADRHRSPPRPAASTSSTRPRTPASPPRSPPSGLRLSEMPMGHAPRPQDFPRRNRIVSGLALGVVVIEGALRSGSLITARNALDQGREVMAVPGNPLDARAGGCNALIRDGADAGPLRRRRRRGAGRGPRRRASRCRCAAPRRARTCPPAAADGPLAARLLELLGPPRSPRTC